MLRSASGWKRADGVIVFGTLCLVSGSMGSQAMFETNTANVSISGMFLCKANLPNFPPNPIRMKLGISMFVS